MMHLASRNTPDTDCMCILTHKVDNHLTEVHIYSIRLSCEVVTTAVKLKRPFRQTLGSSTNASQLFVIAYRPMKEL